MDKTFFIDTENDEANKMAFSIKKKYTGENEEAYKRTVQLQFHEILNHYGLDGDKCISFTRVEIDADKNILLTATMVNGVDSKRYIRNKLGLLSKERLAISSPFPVAGKNIVHYLSLHNIEDQFDEKKTGLFIFAIRAENTEQNVTWQTQYQYVLLRFDTVLGNNKECIEYAKKNGALQFLYQFIESSDKIEEAILDIKEGERYKWQLKNCAEMIIHNL